MIGVYILGSHLGGLLRDLYGPGRENEHEDPHIVASWTGQTERLDPKLIAGRVDFRQLTSTMMAPNDLMRTPQKQPVLHVPPVGGQTGTRWPGRPHADRSGVGRHRAQGGQELGLGGSTTRPAVAGSRSGTARSMSTW